MKRNNFFKAIVCLIAAVTFFAWVSPIIKNAKAEERIERQVIRVAFPTQEGMSFFGHSGKVTGYNYDYLEKISEYTG